MECAGLTALYPAVGCFVTMSKKKIGNLFFEACGMTAMGDESPLLIMAEIYRRLCGDVNSR
jgi:hypothetical protein